MANLNGGLKGNKIYSDEKGEQLSAKEKCQVGSAVRQREGPYGECCVELMCTQKMLTRCGMRKKCAKARLQSVDGDCGVPRLVEEC